MGYVVAASYASSVNPHPSGPPVETLANPLMMQPYVPDAWGPDRRR